MTTDAVLDRAQVEALIPHAGVMCLLDAVQTWRDDHICCLAHSHRDPANPLRDADVLPVVAGIEYAAQAMAVHGGLIGRNDGVPRIGYLAVLNDVRWQVARLDNQGETLLVEARVEQSLTDSRSYSFQLRSVDDAGTGEVLLSGTALVVLESSEAAS